MLGQGCFLVDLVGYVRSMFTDFREWVVDFRGFVLLVFCFGDRNKYG